jgi:hypothetical protein
VGQPAAKGGTTEGDEVRARIVYLSTEGVGGDLEQQTDTITAKLDA